MKHACSSRVLPTAGRGLSLSSPMTLLLSRSLVAIAALLLRYSRASESLVREISQTLPGILVAVHEMRNDSGTALVEESHHLAGRLGELDRSRVPARGLIGVLLADANGCAQQKSCSVELALKLEAAGTRAALKDSHHSSSPARRSGGPRRGFRSSLAPSRLLDLSPARRSDANLSA